MNKQILTDNQETWLTALESKKYTQTEGTFKRIRHKKTCYCALGLAEHLFLSKSKTKSITLRFVNINNALSLTDKPIAEEINSDKIVTYINMKFNKQIPLPPHHFVPRIVALNDEFELTFKQIAKVVRKFPELYFKKAKTNE